jgi:GntR family transcriptional repressor for pyruvate dehydrogenase complex
MAGANDESSGYSLVDTVVKEMQKLLFDDFPLGSTLPSEAALAERFGASRLTVREALKVLAGRGLLEIRRGRRAVVTEPSSDVISSIFAAYVRRDPAAFLELLEVRQALEMQSVAMAARRSSRAGLAAMETALRAMEDAAQIFEDATSEPGDRSYAFEAYQAADVAFHEAIALATGNRMLSRVIEALEESMLHSFRASFEGHMLRGGSVNDTIELHQEIFDHIRAGDARRATQVMRKQLDQADRDLRAALSAPSTGFEMYSGVALMDAK